MKYKFKYIFFLITLTSILICYLYFRYQNYWYKPLLEYSKVNNNSNFKLLYEQLLIDNKCEQIVSFRMYGSDLGSQESCNSFNSKQCSFRDNIFSSIYNYEISKKNGIQKTFFLNKYVFSIKNIYNQTELEKMPITTGASIYKVDIAKIKYHSIIWEKIVISSPKSTDYFFNTQKCNNKSIYEIILI